jgi:glycosyltransferase involved in cell wall biosynthesis
VCATDAGDEVARAGVRPRGVDPEGVELHLFPNLSNRLAYRFQFFTPVGLGAFVAREAARFDVAHLHGCHNLPGAAASRALVRARVPYLVAPNGTAPRIERRRLAKWLFDRTLGRGLLPRASRVLAVSEAERRTLARLGVPAVKLVVVPNPLDLAEIDAGVADPAGFRRRFGIPAAATVVSYLGQLTPRKLVPVLVRAVARLERDDTWLVIAGNDAGAGRAVRAEVLRLGLESRTTFTGLLRGGDRLDALAAAAVVVYPGHDEVFGLVVLEALVLGLPVVVAADSAAARRCRRATTPRSPAPSGGFSPRGVTHRRRRLGQRWSCGSGSRPMPSRPGSRRSTARWREDPDRDRGELRHPGPQR